MSSPIGGYAAALRRYFLTTTVAAAGDPADDARVLGTIDNSFERPPLSDAPDVTPITGER
jgi:hypothetical protein